jgi:hypothetical protein
VTSASRSDWIGWGSGEEKCRKYGRSSPAAAEAGGVEGRERVGLGRLGGRGKSRVWEGAEEGAGVASSSVSERCCWWASQYV